MAPTRDGMQLGLGAAVEAKTTGKTTVDAKTTGKTKETKGTQVRRPLGLEKPATRTSKTIGKTKQTKGNQVRRPLGLEKPSGKPKKPKKPE